MGVSRQRWARAPCVRRQPRRAVDQHGDGRMAPLGTTAAGFVHHLGDGEGYVRRICIARQGWCRHSAVHLADARRVRGRGSRHRARGRDGHRRDVCLGDSGDPCAATDGGGGSSKCERPHARRCGRGDLHPTVGLHIQASRHDATRTGGASGRARATRPARRSTRPTERCQGDCRENCRDDHVSGEQYASLYSAPMPLLDSADRRPVHFVGIAGAGMSALAELFVRRGVTVTGCDANSADTADLRRLGITVGPHDPKHVDGARALVVTSAMPKDHPELQRARECGIPVIRRAEALGEVTNGRELVGVAGTHGKTTTTVMTAEALAAAGRDPTALVGGRVASWGGNLRPGSERLYVVEADEYDRSFLALAPTVAVVTNIEADHLDIYQDLADIRGAFAQFAAGARTIVLCGEDPGATGMRLPTGAEVIRYAVADEGASRAVADARLVAANVRHDTTGSTFEAVWDAESLGSVTLGVPGRHNILNALAALGSGLALGAPGKELARGLETFRGVERRFDRVGQSRGVVILDDYAHHPTEIAATLAAARKSFPRQRVIVAFQPHLFSRTRDFAREFARALAAADALFLTEIYPSRERPIPGVTASLIADEVAPAGGTLAWRGERSGLARALATSVRDGDVVITMGAGDITESGPE